MTNNNETPWGRVDETGTVFVREGDGERAVGQYPDGTPEEALAYFERKFSDLAGQVTLLEQRIKRGAPGADVAKTVDALMQTVVTANAVGDLASLRSRLEALGGAVGELAEKQEAEEKAALQDAIAYRAGLVDEAERLASQDPAKIQWKHTSAAIDDVFARWKAHQQTGPRLPKNEANELWKRFRTARSTLETERKAFFAELDATHKQAKARKQELVAAAESLVAQGADGISQYRRLLDDWKAAGRAGKKHDDALWAKFKAAGDALYAAKSEIDARDNEEFEENLVRKEALLAEAEPLLKATDRDAARQALISIQRRWDEIGKVPRAKVKVIEDRLRKVEAAVRKLDEEHWQRNNPERKARAEGLAAQLESAIAALEADLDDAKRSGDATRITKAQEALDARRAWLGVVSG
ncbi:DUF349 domain-containing protein [Salinibacterium sp. dk2585]|uniref:DUF349 domain-containing protein n=1 Tax=unclassified Salinibacterium TaxID=2632331 RepID=UPI0011C25564|nr:MULTISPECIES: DUF349 domain-containing protein [unclassified Salinibacterium]QEE61290.1 DUF349 domain-containing protein [Salinibacterium sp. dk2585]TXK53966.1 DUF349 domain-containing protein [Salinibacterium sp. dk5596]